MDAREVKSRAFAMPLTSPAFPPGPYRFVNREFFIVTYRTDPDALRSVLPGPLEFSRPVVTEVRPAETFYVAEDYHQEYFRNNPSQPYCAYVVSPKVKKFREKFAAKMRARV